MDITELMRQKADDALESAKHQPDPANLASRIDAYLSDQLSAAEMDSLYRSNRKEIGLEIARREEAVQRKKELDEKNALRIFNGVYTDKEEADARRACSEFGQKHPTVLNLLKNQLTLLEEVANRKQFVTVENLESAYNFLKPQGVFVEPIAAVQSAAEFKAAHIEDWPQPSIPPLILQGIGKVLDTFSANHPEYIHSDSNKDKIMAALPPGVPISLQAVEEAFHNVRDQLDLNNSSQRGELVTFSDLGGHPAGYPPESSKYSFKKLIRGMSSSEFQQRVNDDPKFAASVEALKK